jgi:hypothetical protein
MTYKLWDGALTPDLVQKIFKMPQPFEARKSALFYFSELLQYEKQIKEMSGDDGTDGEGQEGQGDVDGDGNGESEGNGDGKGKGKGNGKPFHEHAGWSNLSKEEQKVATYKLARMAKNSSDKSGGRLPGSIRGELEMLLKALETKVDWRKYLRASKSLRLMHVPTSTVISLSVSSCQVLAS